MIFHLSAHIFLTLGTEIVDVPACGGAMLRWGERVGDTDSMTSTPIYQLGDPLTHTELPSVSVRVAQTHTKLPNSQFE